MPVNHDEAVRSGPKGLLGRAHRRLGFGCGALYAGQRRDNSIRLLEAAIDMDVTYFDTARMYGHGRAEGLLGEVLQRHRDKLIIASKAGILPERRSLVGQVARKSVRMARRVPGLSSVVPDPERPSPTFGVFGVADVRRSVETSLRELRTDHIDILLLHECAFENATDPDVIELLHTLRAEGKIGTYGAATSLETTMALASQRPNAMPILQFKSTAWDANVERVRSHTGAALVTHSVLGASFGGFRQRLKEPAALRERAITVGIDPDDASNLAKIMIAMALQANPTGVVLFSTSKIEHLWDSLDAPNVDADLIAGMAKLIALDVKETAA